MRVLVCGADGFLGNTVASVLERDHEVYFGVRENPDEPQKRVLIDLGNKSNVQSVLSRIRPEVIVNCAGIVDPAGDVSQNVAFTRNILESVEEESVDVKKIILAGSAGEYGVVAPEELPVTEDTPLCATSDYAKSKIDEITFAKEFAAQHSLNVVEARIFNPIGPGMHERFLVSRIIQQIREIKAGTRNRDGLEINRLDAARDYIDVRDVAEAIHALIEHTTRYSEYNIGSGHSMTNKELIDRLLRYSDVGGEVNVIELSAHAEPSVASAADITRVSSDTGWRPNISIDQTIQDIVKEARL